ncbi:MAG: hypothetical protein DRI56_01240 [Chloroflexota bacterium]|nr:MAG: hypothetical protein DRI56_01240 [Chloroflexota bacterium]
METINKKGAINSNTQYTQGTIDAFRHKLLQNILRVISSVGLLIVLMGTLSAIMQEMFWTIAVYWGSYISVLVVLFWKKAPYALQSWVTIIVFFNLGIVNYIPDGLNGVSFIFLLAAVFLGGILLEKQGSTITLSATITAIIAFGVLYTTNILPPPTIRSTEPLEWITSGGVFLLIGLLFGTSTNYLLSRLITALNQSYQLTNELEEHQKSLEKAVEERTASLEKRSTHLEAAAYVARESATIQEVGTLLDKISDLISEHFGFYHTGIFLLDDTKKYAILRAVSSEGGQRMLDNKHRLQVDENSIVGYAAHQGKPRISLDVGEDAVYFNNPYLPDTRSEMALPLRVHGEIIGILDVQSTQPKAFTTEDVATLQTLADQVALAIRNTRLFQESQESLKALQRAYGESSREAWKEFLTSQPNLGERHDPLGVLPPPNQWNEEMKLAVQQEKTVTDKSRTLAIPLKARGQVIGVINALKAQDAPPWIEEEINLIETLTDQLSIALESARSYQETQHRAIRERVISKASSRMRETLDINSVLQTAAKELREALGIAAAEVWVEVEESSENN